MHLGEALLESPGEGESLRGLNPPLPLDDPDVTCTGTASSKVIKKTPGLESCHSPTSPRGGLDSRLDGLPGVAVVERRPKKIAGRFNARLGFSHLFPRPAERRPSWFGSPKGAGEARVGRVAPRRGRWGDASPGPEGPVTFERSRCDLEWDCVPGGGERIAWSRIETGGSERRHGRGLDSSRTGQMPVGGTGSDVPPES